jgi:hypothetical protein
MPATRQNPEPSPTFYTHISLHTDAASGCVCVGTLTLLFFFSVFGFPQPSARCHSAGLNIPDTLIDEWCFHNVVAVPTALPECTVAPLKKAAQRGRWQGSLIRVIITVTTFTIVIVTDIVLVTITITNITTTMTNITTTVTYITITTITIATTVVAIAAKFTTTPIAAQIIIGVISTTITTTTITIVKKPRKTIATSVFPLPVITM